MPTLCGYTVMHACADEEKNSWVMPQTLCYFTLSPLRKAFHLNLQRRPRDS
jgi:hypothetical protein